MRGFFSIVRFCPDLSRGECANVGIVLVVPPLGFFGVRMSDDNEGPRQRFGAHAFDDARLSMAKVGIKARLLATGSVALPSPEQLQRFANQEGNNLVMGAPRVILVEEDPSATLATLFSELVAEAPRDVGDDPLSKIFGAIMEVSSALPVDQEDERIVDALVAKRTASLDTRRLRRRDDGDES